VSRSSARLLSSLIICGAVQQGSQSNRRLHGCCSCATATCMICPAFVPLKWLSLCAAPPVHV